MKEPLEEWWTTIHTAGLSDDDLSKDVLSWSAEKNHDVIETKKLHHVASNEVPLQSTLIYLVAI